MSNSVLHGRRLAAIMFADIVGYTAMMQDNESTARSACTRFRTLLQDLVPRHSGEIVQFYGDGALILFDSAKEGVRAALEVQAGARAEPAVPLRIGLHMGDVVLDESGVYGDAVNVASRIESMAIPGAVLLSGKVARELENHPDLRTRPLGEFTLKNVRRPVRVHAVQDIRIAMPSPGQIQEDAKASATRTIAVMPFTALGRGEESAYFADGLSLEITNGLARVDGLSIISRSTCLAVQEEDRDPIRIGARLKVRHLLEGSVRKAGDDIRVSVQLVNTADGSLLWSETYDRVLDRVFEVQDEVARLVVNGLKLNFETEPRGQTIIEPATDNSEAYTLYLKGLHHWNTRTPESGQKALGLLESALRLDPDFPAAECALSQCYGYLGSCGVLSPRDAYHKALDHAMSAIERNPKLPEAHLALAALRFYHLWDWEGTRSSLEKAEALGLDSGEFHQVYGYFLATVGEPEAGLPRLQRAVELDPLSVPTLYALAALHTFVGEIEVAMRYYDEIIELNPAFRGAYQLKGFALLMLGRLDEALVVLKDYHARVNHPLKGLLCLTLVHHLLGNEAEFADGHARMVRRLEEDGGASTEVDLALLSAGLGRFDEAIAYLHNVYDQRYSIACTGVIWVLRCPYFAELWKQPEYKVWLKRMGLER